MDRREPPRIGSIDASPLDLDAARASLAPSRRFARLVGSPTVRRLVVAKVGRAGVIAATVLGLLVVGGWGLSQSLVKWLHHNKIYDLAFRDIELIPEPPRWIKSGRAGLLEQVRDGRDHLQSFSMLEVDLDKLLIDFRRNPWVARADRATRAYPNKIAVSLAYFEPVATVRCDKETYSVDRDAIVLVQEEIDLQHAGPLVEIIAVKPRIDPKPGLAWPEEADSSRSAKLEPRPRVALAAKLAGFFKHRLIAEGPTASSLVPDQIYAKDPEGLFIWMKDKTLVFWGSFEKRGTPGEPTDLAKWEMLAAKAKAEGGLKVEAKEYLHFEGGKVQVGRFP